MYILKKILVKIGLIDIGKADPIPKPEPAVPIEEPIPVPKPVKPKEELE